METQTFGPGPRSQGSRPKSCAPVLGAGRAENKLAQPPTRLLASCACPCLPGAPLRWQPPSVPPVPRQQQVGPSGPGRQLVLAGGGGVPMSRRVQTPSLESAFRNDVSSSQVSNTKRHAVFMFIKRA